jgi:hypothetical protein
MDTAKINPKEQSTRNYNGYQYASASSDNQRKVQ